jgi:LAS superfamily LD-carboxypeptidase LdcB
MKRKDFLKINALAILGLGNLSFQNLKHQPTDDFLTGRSNSKLTKDKLLHKTAFKAFEEMRKAAKQKYIDIKIVSGYRSFNHQLSIWNRKYQLYSSQGLTGPEILEEITKYSAIPGTSRHHWGTEIDIIDANNSKPESNILKAENYHETGNYCELNQWMQKNAHNFGFYQVYTNDKNRTGFSYEPWHYSFKPLAKKYFESYIKIDLSSIYKNEDILGKAYLNQNYLFKYSKSHIYGINPELLS